LAPTGARSDFFEETAMPRFSASHLLAPLLLATLLVGAPPWARAQEAKRVGSVDTTFKLLGRNDRIGVDRYDDPRVSGVSCYLSRAETGGLKGSFGLATDPSRFSIACRATGPVTLNGTLPASETVFDERASIFFKTVRVTRMYDPEKRVLLYLVWSTQALGPDGSPFNSLTAVPLDR
jgi:CreA protein